MYSYGGAMNDTAKSVIFCIALFVVALVFCCLFGGCSSTRGLQAEDAELVSANTRNLGRIESTVDALDATVRSSNERLEIVARAGERIRDAGQRLEYLFGEYEREVDRLLDEIDTLRVKLQEGEKDQVDARTGVDSGKYNTHYNVYSAE